MSKQSTQVARNGSELEEIARSGSLRASSSTKEGRGRLNNRGMIFTQGLIADRLSLIAIWVKGKGPRCMVWLR